MSAFGRVRETLQPFPSRAFPEAGQGEAPPSWPFAAWLPAELSAREWILPGARPAHDAFWTADHFAFPREGGGHGPLQWAVEGEGARDLDRAWDGSSTGLDPSDPLSAPDSETAATAFEVFLRKSDSVPTEGSLTGAGVVFRPAETRFSGQDAFGPVFLGQPSGPEAAQVLPADVSPLTVSSDPLTAIDWGTAVPTTTIDVYFAPAGTYIDGIVDFGPAQGFTSFETQQILSALDQFAAVTNLTFRVTTSQFGAELRLGTFDLDAYDAIAFMVPPGEPNAGFMGFDPDYLRWYDGDSGNPLLSTGGFIYAVLLEELGHGLGLAHPHDDGGTSTILEGVTAPIGSYGVGDLNQGVFTTMGYNEGWPAGPYGDEYYDGTYIYVNDFGYEATPMALDVAVLQAKYGANLGHAAGDDVYFLPEANGIGTYYTSIWDVAGTDRIQFDGTQDAIIDLRPATLLGEVGGGGFVSYAAGIRGGFTIAAGVVIENATGGAGQDQITGNDAANVLDGGDGDDWLFGGIGDDTLIGGAGGDALVGGAGNDVLRGAGALAGDMALYPALPDRLELFDTADHFVF